MAAEQRRIQHAKRRHRGSCGCRGGGRIGLPPHIGSAAEVMMLSWYMCAIDTVLDYCDEAAWRERRRTAFLNRFCYLKKIT